VTANDWVAWHAACDDDTPMRHRLLTVQRRIRGALDDRPADVVTVGGPETQPPSPKMLARRNGAVSSSWS
jgi:hypothetical protein